MVEVVSLTVRHDIHVDVGYVHDLIIFRVLALMCLQLVSIAVHVRNAYLRVT